LNDIHIVYFIPKKYYWTEKYGRLQKFYYTLHFDDGIQKKYCAFFDTEALIAQSIVKDIGDETK